MHEARHPSASHLGQISLAQTSSLFLPPVTSTGGTFFADVQKAKGAVARASLNSNLFCGYWLSLAPPGCVWLSTPSSCGEGKLAVSGFSSPV